MKKILLKSKFSVILFLAGFFCLFFAVSAWAGEGQSGWRHIYDQIMVIFNFGIIVFCFFKFGKKPLIDFLKGQKENIREEINEVENRKQEIETKLDELRAVMDDSKVRFENIRQRIIQQGEKKKTAIIADAEQQSKLMIESALRRVDSGFIQVQNIFRKELVDAAMDLALKKLPEALNDKDNQYFIDQYLTGADSI